ESGCQAELFAQDPEDVLRLTVHLVFAEANDLVAEGAEPLVAQGIGFYIERRSVKPVAVDLGDHQLRAPEAVDASDEAVVVEHFHLQARRGKSAVIEKG